MSARERLISALSGGHESQRAPVSPLADDILAEHARELAEKIRRATHDGTGAFDWWDAATIPGECADLIDPSGGTK